MLNDKNIQMCASAWRYRTNGLYYLETELCKGVSIDTGVAYPKSDGSSAS